MRLMSRRPSSSFKDSTHTATASKYAANKEERRILERRSEMHHDGSEVLALEAVDGQLQRLVERRRNPLSDEAVEVDGAAEELDVALLQQSLIAVGGGPRDVGTLTLALGS